MRAAFVLRCRGQWLTFALQWSWTVCVFLRRRRSFLGWILRWPGAFFGLRLPFVQRLTLSIVRMVLSDERLALFDSPLFLFYPFRHTLSPSTYILISSARHTAFASPPFSLLHRPRNIMDDQNLDDYFFRGTGRLSAWTRDLDWSSTLRLLAIDTHVARASTFPPTHSLPLSPSSFSSSYPRRRGNSMRQHLDTLCAFQRCNRRCNPLRRA